MSLESSFNQYFTCTKNPCGTIRDPNTGELKYVAEKNSGYLSEFIDHLGHPTLESFQTKVFDLALPTSTNNYNQIPFPVDCPVNGTGVITIFLIPKTEHCKRDILKPKESRTKNIFISVQESCNFESGLELKFIIHIPCNSFSST